MYRICCCSLAGTAACYGCLGRYQYDWSMPYVPYYPTYPDYTSIPIKPHIRKITEKFDKDGKLTERIVEEESSEYNYSWNIVNTGSKDQYIVDGTSIS